MKSVPDGNPTLMKCEHMSCSYGGAPVIENVDVTINRGEFLGIVGPSGSGKTTIVHHLLEQTALNLDLELHKAREIIVLVAATQF